MLNLRAIAEGTQPDVYIKPDDRINVGTNFWATPLAVLRGGFRVNYGSGFCWIGTSATMCSERLPQTFGR